MAITPNETESAGTPVSGMSAGKADLGKEGSVPSGAGQISLSSNSRVLGVDFAQIGRDIAFGGYFIPLFAYLFMLADTLVFLSNGPWQTEKDGHGLYILIITAAFFAVQYKSLRALESKPAPLAGWFFLLLGLFLFLVGRSQSQVFFAMGAQIPIIAGVFLLLKGWDAIKLTWFPLVFLGFAVPLPGWFLDGTTQWAKLSISEIVTNGLHTLGYPVAQDGVVIWIYEHKLLVEDACSGLNALYSLMAVGFLYVYLTRSDTFLRNILLILWILPAAFVSNLVRVALLVMITHHFGVEAGQGFLHDFAGFVMFLVALLSFFLIDGLLIWLGIAKGGLSSLPARLSETGVVPSVTENKQNIPAKQNKKEQGE